MTPWKSRRVLVTGAAGFIGSNLCRTLVSAGAVVTGVDNLARQGGGRLDHVRDIGLAAFHQVGISYLEVGRLGPIDVIFNLAGLTSHLGAQADPIGDLNANASAQLHFIEQTRAHCPKARVVHTSTRQVYGRPQTIPVSEAHPVDPPDCNAISKFAGEGYWLMERQVHGRCVSVLRLTNCYGPRMRIRDAAQCFVGIWVRRALEGGEIEVWGGDHLRDLCYVDDVVTALIEAADAGACFGEALNVGGGEALSLRDLAELFPGAQVTLREMPEERAAIDIGSFVSDDRAFRRATGWRPAWGAAAGVAATLEWFRGRWQDYCR